jgi:hypothetical protein
MKTMVIKAEKQDDGTYRLMGINPEGKKEYHEKEYKTMRQAYIDASCLWPTNSTWQGRKVKSGYRIVID